ncbi:hypothetical protein [Streptomyces sp. b94]|uniref:hypothetical protein n=1 Tax=Streptomyces sp. b94 TaxID=1827634 RepID=UPI000BF10BBA|nr:hypothetical protein [Streptomyces sp. b94]
MGLFSRKPAAPIHATAEQTRRINAYAAELAAERDKAEARARVQKWDRITKSMTARGEDHEGRDMAIRNRDRAKRDERDAETRALRAKFRR